MQWVDFVRQPDFGTERDKKQKKITKYSSICSRHFLPSDFSQSQARKFLKKNAVPSLKPKSRSCAIINTIECLQDDEPIVEIEEEDPLGSNDSCSLCHNSEPFNSKLKLIDEFFFSLIRKCLPLIIDLNFLHKICEDCMKLLNTFSSFIDKVVQSQNTMTIPKHHSDNEPLNIKSYIKIEPIASYEDEEKISNDLNKPWSLINRNLSALTLTPPKKCEILEIVDIKPFHFDGTMHHESYDDEDDIQILSPKQLKVEIDPDDEDGSNELEQIRNYLFISKVFLQDHNYVKSNVKIEFEDETTKSQIQSNVSFKLCNLCNKSFSSFKKYLAHKIHFHPITKKSEKSQELNRVKTTKRQKYDKIRKICKKIIRTKKEKAEEIEKTHARVQRKKSYNCPICNKCFAGPKNLYQHKISHAPTSFTCRICDKKFQRPHGLKQHIQSIHDKDKKHVCPICNYRYLLKADMIKCRHSKLKKSFAQ